MDDYSIAVIGGGAAGFFGAIACAESFPGVRVVILEKTRQLLTKVRISGGGRCNVTHNCFDPILLTQHYPRGHKALVGPFSRFNPKDTIQWFQEHGVFLKTEEDGRLFPTTDNSETIISCFKKEAERLGIEIRIESEVISIEKKAQEGFKLQLHNEKEIHCQHALIAGGSSTKMYKMLELLGHKIISPVPSLFTFLIPDKRLEGLAGISLPSVKLHLIGTHLKQTGPLLITHSGLSGPAVLKLSAWGARALYEMDYKASLEINWLPQETENEVKAYLYHIKKTAPNKTVFAEGHPGLPKNLWKKLVIGSGIEEKRLYAHLSNQELHRLVEQLFRGRFNIEGKSPYKEEFVTCGGIDLDQVDFQKMQSRICPGLYFAGEILDIDGVTGGFNFQNAWTTGWIAAQAITSSLNS